MDPNDPGLDEMARRISIGRGPDLAEQRQWLENPLLRAIAAGVGVDLAEIDELHRERWLGLAALRQAATLFGPFGWTVSPRQLNETDYIEALRLWEETHDEGAIDAHLTRAWADRVWLRQSFGPLTTLAGRHEATLDDLLARHRLLNKALDHHERDEYEASTLIVLTQIDGLTFDFTEGKFGFFYRAEDEFFEDDQTLAGMPEFLKTVRQAVNRDDHKTSLSTVFRRSPILHGRYPAFGTETNSAKAFALLSGVIDWLKPRAALLTERWQAEHEAEYAGSEERDPEGRRLDRRGFEETRESLRWLAIRETNEHRHSGRYNADLQAMFPREGIGLMRRRDRTTLSVAADGQSYWAWCPSDTDVCFGIAARGGESMILYYADLGPPGHPDKDSRWAYESDAPIPDWSGD